MTLAPILSTHHPETAAILAVAEDGLAGFHERPFAVIAERAGLPETLVIDRIRDLLEAGVVRRVRQTLNTGSLAHGALVAWKVPAETLHQAFDTLFRDDPFSGHVVVRSTDSALPGAAFRLWTTVKVPQGFSLARHVELMGGVIGAEATRIMPARCLFALGVGHVRRRSLEPGARADVPAEPLFPELTRLSPFEWQALAALKEPLEPAELAPEPWRARAARLHLPYEQFLEAVRGFERSGLLARFSTFLEHVKELPTGERVTRYNALFHWAVEPGRELEAGAEVGRHHIITHAYWREAGPEFGNVNVMAVAHGTEKDALLAHKAAIDAHLAEAGIPVSYTTQFWGGRSEIKPSEILPDAYEAFCRERGIDPETMREES
jgi:DNA-binding Lrp family transcriptional regulator